jgi:DNA invertase Pin-like site-specific DNA recombinase
MSKARIAVSYVRVSGLGQRDGDGPERQRQAIARAAKRQRLTIAKEFADMGVSGTTEGADRPGMAALLAEVAQLGATVVLVEKADRLARDVLVAELLLRSFRQLGVAVLTSDGVDLTAAEADATQVLVRQLLAAVAQFDRASIVAKLRVARDRKRAATGRCEGPRPFGHLPGEAEALEQLRAIARKKPGCDAPTMAEVAVAANAAGIRSRSGKPWTRGTCWNVLRAS